MKMLIKKIDEMILKIDSHLCINFRLPDRMYLKIKYRYTIGKKLNLKSPKDFNEKLQWLKLYDRKEEYTNMADKYLVKSYVENIIGKDYLIPTLGLYRRCEDIEFEKMPNKFVLKCTHNSGGVFICNNKKNFDVDTVKKMMKEMLKKNYYYAAREWPYKNIKPQIIAEEYIKDDNEEDLKDYKIFCFNGKPQFILVCSNRNGVFKNTDFYDTEWNLMPFTRQNHKNNPEGIEKPKKLEKMLDIAEKLSKDIPFVRVDLYEVNEKIYFGELTFYPSAGFEGFNPPEYDKILGDMLELPKEKLEEKNEK